MEQTDIKGLLRGCELFKDLDEKDIEKIVQLCTIESFESGKEVIQQGDFVEHIYVIAEGRVILERSVNLSSGKGTVPVDVLGKGRIFGCWSTLLGEAHILNCTVTCQKPTVCLVAKGSALREVMQTNKDLGFSVLQNLCNFLRKRMQILYGAMEKL